MPVKNATYRLSQAKPSTYDKKRPYRQILIIVLIIGTGFLLYLNTLKAPFNFDDRSNIVVNPHIRLTELNLLQLKHIFDWSPLPRLTAYFSFALNYYFHRYEVTGYHLFNLSLHILTTLFLFQILRLTLKFNADSIDQQPFNSFSRTWLAGLGALLWMVHPLHTQSVTFIAQRMNSLAAMFYLLALWAYIKGRYNQLQSKPAITSIRWFLLAAAAGLLALTSKQISFTLPLMIVLYEWFFLQPQGASFLRQNWKWLFLTGALLIIIGLIYLNGNPLQTIKAGYQEQTFTPGQRIMTQWPVVIYYLSLLAWPHPARLNLIPDFPLSHSLMAPPTTILCLFAIIMLLYLAYYLSDKNKMAAFALFWFFLTLVIESTIIALAIIFEHRTYLPSMMICPLLLLLAFSHRRFRIIGILIFFSLLLMWASGTYQRNQLWHNKIKFWQDCVDKAPRSEMSHHNLATALMENGHLPKAIHHLKTALQFDPDSYKIYVDLGNAMRKSGQLLKAFKNYQKAITIDPQRPEAHFKLGTYLMKKGYRHQAISHFQTVLRVAPGFPPVYNPLGLILLEKDQVTEAIKCFQNALKLDPENHQARFFLEQTQSIRHNPESVEAHINLGTAFSQLNMLESASEHFQAALKQEPDRAQVHDYLGMIKVRQHLFKAAQDHFETALGLDPNCQAAQQHLDQLKKIQQNQSN